MCDILFIGCSADVLSYMDTVCSGRQTCKIEVNDLDKIVQPCSRDFKSYLEAGHKCIKGELCTKLLLWAMGLLCQTTRQLLPARYLYLYLSCTCILYVYVFVFLFVFIFIFVFMFIFLFTFTFVFVFTFMFTFAFIFVFTFMFTFAFTFVFTFTYSLTLALSLTLTMTFAFTY